MRDTPRPPPGGHSQAAAAMPLFSRGLTRGQLLGIDGLVAVGFTVMMVSFAAANTDPQRSGVVLPLWLSSLIIMAMGLPLSVRRLWPVPVLAVVATATVVAQFVSLPRDFFGACAFALYIVALTVPVHRLVPHTAIGVVTVIGVVCMSMAGTVDMSSQSAGVILIGFVVLGAGWTLGRGVRDRRATAAQSAQRMADQLLAEERLHIARELHDVVAHSMSLIAVKAAVANHVARKRPEEAFDALRVIEATSKSSLTEMRRILGILRADGHTPAELAPAPDLSALPALVDNAAMAGVRVDIRSVGVRELPADIALSAYRIVQEAVTNVVKHAAPADCRVEVTVADGCLRIEVTDNGPGSRMLPGNPGGHGLVGMAERVAMYGGELSFGPKEPGGFGVLAVIPLSPLDEPQASQGES